MVQYLRSYQWDGWTIEKEQNTNDEKHALQVSHVRVRRQMGM